VHRLPQQVCHHLYLLYNKQLDQRDTFQTTTTTNYDQALGSRILELDEVCTVPSRVSALDPPFQTPHNQVATTQKHLHSSLHSEKLISHPYDGFPNSVMLQGLSIVQPFPVLSQEQPLPHNLFLVSENTP
jgi:hypothetical protein